MIGFGAVSAAPDFLAGRLAAAFFAGFRGAGLAARDFAFDVDEDLVLAGGLLVGAGAGAAAVAAGDGTGTGGVGVGGGAAAVTAPACVATGVLVVSRFGSGVSFPPVNSPSMNGLAMQS